MVLALLRGEASQQELARRHDVSAAVISRWRDQFIEGGALFLKNENRDLHRDSRVQMLEGEVEKRDQIIGELTIANRLLKKGVFTI
jgi:transposase-like protein